MPNEPEARTEQGSPHGSRRRRLLGGIALVILMAGLLVWAIDALGSQVHWAVIGCSPPSQGALKVQEAFVRSHLSDASGIEAGIADCDDDGDGYVSCATNLSPAAARDAFLADRACSPYDDEGGDIAVVCKSTGEEVYIFFEKEAGRTAGRLYGITG